MIKGTVSVISSDQANMAMPDSQRYQIKALCDKWNIYQCFIFWKLIFLSLHGGNCPFEYGSIRL